MIKKNEKYSKSVLFPIDKLNLFKMDWKIGWWYFLWVTRIMFQFNKLLKELLYQSSFPGSSTKEKKPNRKSCFLCLKKKNYKFQRNKQILRKSLIKVVTEYKLVRKYAPQYSDNGRLFSVSQGLQLWVDKHHFRDGKVTLQI